VNARLGVLAVIVGLVLHLLVAPFFFAAGLIVPGPVAVLLVAVWVGLLIAAVLRRRQPRFVLSVPVIDAAVWFLVVQGGSWIFGWTA
jgi:hypothetical protein